MSNDDTKNISASRDELLKQHRETSKYIASLALRSNKTSMTFKLRFAKFYKSLFGLR